MRIYKYQLPDIPGVFILQLPKGSIPLSVGVQHDELVLWVMVNEFEDDLEYKFRLLITGEDFDETNLKFIGTIQLNGLVYHLFHEVG